jgi:RNA polymerase sigma-70 factor (sigma-E family)
LDVSASPYYVDFVDTDTSRADCGNAARQVTALYQAHALSLARLALVMLGDAAAAEDVVQDAFFGLYRRWSALEDPGASVGYLRTSVLNSCRTALRRQPRHSVLEDSGADVISHDGPEAAMLLGEEHRAVLEAIRRLPARQREALVLRYYLDMTEEEAASAMRVSRGTVKSATSRALAAVGRMLKENP